MENITSDEIISHDPTYLSHVILESDIKLLDRAVIVPMLKKQSNHTIEIILNGVSIRKQDFEVITKDFVKRILEGREEQSDTMERWNAAHKDQRELKELAYEMAKGILHDMLSKTDKAQIDDYYNDTN